MLRILITTTALGLGLCACSQPQRTAERPAVDTQLNSGITSSNGGGQRQTGGFPAVSIGNSGAQNAAPSARGSAY